MKIVNQDRDEVVKSGRLIIEVKRYRGYFMGFNIYNQRWFKRVLLGTYDTFTDASQIKVEIRKLVKRGVTDYIMPKPALDLDEIELLDEILELED